MDLDNHFRNNEQYVNQFYMGQLNDYSVLKLYVNKDNQELVDLYRSHIENHNQSLVENLFPNAGFDLFVPEQVDFNNSIDSKMINLQVKAELIHIRISTYSLMEMYKNEQQPKTNALGTSNVTSFYVYPRSSMSKTPLMLANHVGIIDTGYRGNLIAAVRNLSDAKYTIEKHTRLFQICDPILCPIYVVLVDNENELTPTSRGEGGFGSTGIIGSIKA